MTLEQLRDFVVRASSLPADTVVFAGTDIHCPQEVLEAHVVEPSDDTPEMDAPIVWLVIEDMS